MYIKKMIGRKCYLSPMELSDAGTYAAWLNDLEVSTFTQIAKQSLPVEKEREILSAISKEHNYGIVDAASGELIGSCGLMDLDAVNRSAEIGIVIGDKAYWGRGYGEEALRLLLDYAYRYLNLYNVMLRVYSYNARGIACYEKVGFKAIGRRRGAVMRNLEAHDVVFMDITADDFYAAAPAPGGRG
ncbi:MAG: GNAT family N-acetyltransferase [Spirochaetes bacterium]|nr:GNAT family N-acetyltransferase [Spirochaetota bacterium]MBU1079853.1 GNAT family N-acetyltransferase [Spirochaetota bacterium]